MPSKLYKVHKHISKKKGSKINALHENSRDALRLRQAGARDEKVIKLNATREKANQPWLDRIAFLKEHLPETLHPLSLEEIQALIQSFLGRLDEELVQLKAERRPGRPPTARQSMLEQTISAEIQEYKSGFWLVNLQDEETLQKLDAWPGDWLSLSVLRFVRVTTEGGIKESSFPPRGTS